MSRPVAPCGDGARRGATKSGSPARSGTAPSLGKLADPSGHLRARYCVPSPRLGLPLAGVVSAAIDVSDGLLQDIGHLCRLAGCGAEIEAGLVPLSDAARAAGPGWLAECLGGGDDYELVLAVPEGRGAALAAACLALGVPLTLIGRFTPGPPAVRVIDSAHETVTIARHGWSHF
jgi:thiamine-monophosphate kinase